LLTLKITASVDYCFGFTALVLLRLEFGITAFSSNYCVEGKKLRLKIKYTYRQSILSRFSQHVKRFWKNSFTDSGERHFAAPLPASPLTDRCGSRYYEQQSVKPFSQR